MIFFGRIASGSSQVFYFYVEGLRGEFDCMMMHSIDFLLVRKGPAEKNITPYDVFFEGTTELGKTPMKEKFYLFSGVISVVVKSWDHSFHVH